MRNDLRKSSQRAFCASIAAILQSDSLEEAGQIRKAAITATGSGSFTGFDELVRGEHFLAEEYSPDGVLKWLVREAIPGKIGLPVFAGSGITAAYSGEGLGIGISRYSASGALLSRTKVAGGTVIQKEIAQYPELIAAVERSLTQAVRKAEDERLLAMLYAGTSNILDSTGVAPMYDFQQALEVVNVTAFSRMAAVLHPSNINTLATSLGDNSGLLVFPDAIPGPGGSVLGIPVIPSEAAGNSLYLIDANSCVFADEGLVLRTSENAQVELVDSSLQDSTEPTSGTGATVSVFQINAIALMGLRSFGLHLLRSSGCCVVENLGWSTASTTTTAGA